MFNSSNSEVSEVSSRRVEASEVWEFCRTNLSSLEVAAVYQTSTASVVSVAVVVVVAAVVAVDDEDGSSVPISEDISVGSSVLSSSPRRS